MAIIVSNDSVNFSTKAPLKESITFIETLTQKTTGKLYDILINAIGPEAEVYQLSANLHYSSESPLIFVEYLKGKSSHRSQMYISWKIDHWDIYHTREEPRFTMEDSRIGRSADGLPTHDC